MQPFVYVMFTPFLLAMCYHFITTEQIVYTYFSLLLHQLGMEKMLVLFKSPTTCDDETSLPITPTQKEKEIVLYEDKYKDKIAQLKEVDLTEERLVNLKNSVLFEKTPLGNVIMYYDHSRETFTFYSDSSIPYRYLETISRRYVVLNNCKKIYVNMEEEIKCAEKKIEEKKQIQLRKQEEEERLRAQEPESQQQQQQQQQQQPKRNVFAKLKKYNRIDAKPNANPNTKPTPNSAKKDDSDDKVLKERANRYSCEGKLANFSFLKKVDRKLVDSKYAMSFAEFKKLSMNQTKNA